MRIIDNQRLVLGAPGCGKTTRLIGLMEEEMASGIPPQRIGFMSFTKKAATEAAQRACLKFGFEERQLPYFRTLHSLAYREVGLSQSRVMTWRHYNELGKILGIKFTGRYDDEGLPTGGEDGDNILFIDGLARARKLSLEEQYHRLADPGVEWQIVKRFSDVFIQYKRERGLYDFTDMLEMYVKRGRPLELTVAFIDEAQDLSPLQWDVAKTAFAHVERLYIAGDDDQAIYRWSGADVDTFMSVEGDREVLDTSHRLPRSVWHLAHSIAGRIDARIAKKFGPREEEGTVQFHPYPESVHLDHEGSWLLLCRNVFQMKALEAHVKEQGLTYTSKGKHSVKQEHVNAIYSWEHLRKHGWVSVEQALAIYDALSVGIGYVRGGKGALESMQGGRAEQIGEQELRDQFGLKAAGIWHDALDAIPYTDKAYYLTVLRRGGSLVKPPRVTISTIHGVKGGEADNVMLLTDMSRRTYNESIDNPDDEHRVFYVAVTRARHNLHVVLPQTPSSYSMPRVSV